MQDAAISPFRIAVEQDVLDDLAGRLASMRWPDALDGAGWEYGTDLDFLRALVDYWRDGYDWRTQENGLNAWPQYRTEIDGLGIHFVHVEGSGPDPLPLVLSHGWPSHFFEMHKVIGPLADPAAHGGDPVDAFHVVVPSLPGYGFSDRPTKRGLDTRRIADLWKTLMVDRLGYARFGAQGGDWGAAINTDLGQRHADRLVGLHFNMLSPPIDPAALTPEQAEWWREVQAYRDEEWGYVHLQRTKPQTPAFALNDSPVGLAAWILEKWRRWSDCEGDLLRVYSRDELLTIVMIYWVTQTIGSSMRLYREIFARTAGPGRYEVHGVPVGVAAFNEVNRPPRALCEPHFDLHRFTVMERGGHFPAMEVPRDLVDEIRAFFRPLRAR